MAKVPPAVVATPARSKGGSATGTGAVTPGTTPKSRPPGSGGKVQKRKGRPSAVKPGKRPRKVSFL